MFKSLLIRPVWLPAAIIAALLIVSLCLLMGTSWRSLQRLQPIHAHQSELYQLQFLSLELQEALLDSLDGDRGLAVDQMDRLQATITRLTASDASLNPETPGWLRRAGGLLSDLPHNPQGALIAALGEIQQALKAESLAHDSLLKGVHNDALLEFRTSAALTGGFPLVAMLLLFLLRRRILLPLDNLRALMGLLGRHEYRTAPTDDVDPLLVPVFENYNHMVTRLEELEHRHRERQHSLEASVRSATTALLQQQRELARTERLAAVGEVAAGVAHELRNPLTGIQMALRSLREDVTDAEQRERLDLVLSEIKRLARLLNQLLEQARTPPEPAVELEVDRVVRDLLGLTRYQVPENIILETGTLEAVPCRLPEAALRQAVLNLILNAAQALGAEGGTIEVSARREGDRLVLAVCDDGPGFPALLLEEGVRSFASWRDHGTGLGLAMVQRFARDRDGRLQLANRAPHGACATLDLPCGTHHG